MQRLFRSMIALMLVATLSSNALAAKKAKKGNDTPASTMIDKMIKSVTGLTDDETKKLDALKDEYNPKLKEAYAKLDSVVTDDQKKAGAAASKEAKAAGKKGKELAAAVADAQKLTDDQKKQMADDKTQVAAINKELNEKVMAVLTADQQAQAAPKKGKKK